LTKTEKPLVAAVETRSYDKNIISAAVGRLFELLGMPEKLVEPGRTVALKPNLLMAAEPEKAVTTHPEVVGAVADIAVNSGAVVRIVDSPGSGTLWSEGSLSRVYRKCGLDRLAAEKIHLNNNLQTRKIAGPNSKLIKTFEFIEAALDADMLINIAKAKTHTFTYMTCAVKNLFGLVPGFDKPGYHARMKNPENFAEMLVDLAEAAKPSFSIVDAVVGMEGDGPTSGTPRNIGLLLASTDPYALDTIVAHMMGFDPMQVPVIASAVARGLTSGRFNDIEIVGDTDAVKPIPHFKLPRTFGGTGLAGGGWLVNLLQPILKRMWVLNPVPVKRLCVGCGACEDACPNDAIKIIDGRAAIARDQCIRCYCCHEACPHGAMKLKRSILYSLFHKVAR